MHRDVESSVQKRHGHGDIAVHSEGSIKMIQGMDHLHNDVRLRQLGLLSLEKTLGRSHCGLSVPKEKPQEIWRGTLYKRL